MLARFLDSIADSFRHRFGWPSRDGEMPDEYQETPAEQRIGVGVHRDARAVDGHVYGNPDGRRSSDTDRRR